MATSNSTGLEFGEAAGGVYDDIGYPDTDDDLGYPSYKGTLSPCVSPDFPDTDDDLDYPSYRGCDARPHAAEMQMTRTGARGAHDQNSVAASTAEANTPYHAAIPFSRCAWMPFVMMPCVVSPAAPMGATHGYSWPHQFSTAPLAQSTWQCLPQSTQSSLQAEYMAARVRQSIPAPTVTFEEAASSSESGDGYDSFDGGSSIDSFESLGSYLRYRAHRYADYVDYDDSESDSEYSDTSTGDAMLIHECHEYVCSVPCEEMCTICLDSYTVGQSVCSFPVCKHTFHKECLMEWLKRRPKCPNCRRHILTRPTH